MSTLSQSEKEMLQDLLEENKLSHETKLYRFTSERFLNKNDDGTESLVANNVPIEMLVDNYNGQGHVFIARDIGKGLSFLTEPLDEYVREDRVCVSVSVGDLLDQGGLIYKVTSLPAYISAFFFTMPTGVVPVKKS